MPDLKREFLTPTFVLAVLGWSLLAFTIVLFAFIEIPDKNRDASLMLLGVVIVLAKDPWAFFFASTRQSEAKTQLLAEQSATIAAQTTQLAGAVAAPPGTTRAVDLQPGESTDLEPGHKATVSVGEPNPQS